MQNVYTDGTYVQSNPSMHEEDSPWKAAQITRMFEKHKLDVRSIAEIGCGAGGILAELYNQLPPNIEYSGYDISPAAIAMAREKERDRLHFYEQDLFKREEEFDLLLVIDVVEHVPDYLGFLEACRRRAARKIYHIPLDLHVSSVLRASFVDFRTSIGHIQSFTAESALASLVDTGHKITDCFYTNGAVSLARYHRSLKRAMANLPRRIMMQFSSALAARLLGGFSLLVLTQDDKA